MLTWGGWSRKYLCSMSSIRDSAQNLYLEYTQPLGFQWILVDRSRQVCGRSHSIARCGHSCTGLRSPCWSKLQSGDTHRQHCNQPEQVGLNIINILANNGVAALYIINNIYIAYKIKTMNHFTFKENPKIKKKIFEIFTKYKKYIHIFMCICLKCYKKQHASKLILWISMYKCTEFSIYYHKIKIIFSFNISKSVKGGGATIAKIS